LREDPARGRGDERIVVGMHLEERLRREMERGLRGKPNFSRDG
jgi:hypothetical protein